MPRALIVTITEGVELLPQAAFLSSALRQLGFDPKLLPTDFCTTQDSFQTAVTASDPAAVVFLDAVEWREVLVTLSGFACNVTRGPVLIATALAGKDIPTDFPGRVIFVQDGDPEAIARALGVVPKAFDVAALSLDYSLFGGVALVGRGMGCSLFGDTGTAALLAHRWGTRDCSPVAALARLEGSAAASDFDLTGEAMLAPLFTLGSTVRAVEWWDRNGMSDGMVKEVKTTLGVPQTIRVPSDCAGTLDGIDYIGVTRVVFDCDALDDAPGLRLPGAQGSAGEVIAAAEVAKREGLEVGVLLVIGLPGETAMITKGRCDRLRKAGLNRIRVIPFEPTGGTEAWEWCVKRGIWPPRNNRWNRELYQPLEQPEAAEYGRVLEEALMLVADVETRSGVST